MSLIVKAQILDEQSGKLVLTDLELDPSIIRFHYRDGESTVAWVRDFGWIHLEEPFESFSAMWTRARMQERIGLPIHDS